MQQTDDRDPPSPCGPELGPDIGTFKGPGRDQHNKLVRLLEEGENVLLEVGANVDLRLVEERGRSTGGDLARDLPGHPGVYSTMTHEYETLSRAGHGAPAPDPSRCTN